MSVMWLATHVDRGVVAFEGPVTGIAYLVSPQGTPVHEADFEPMLTVLGEPCCGKPLPPFAIGVRIFRPHTATVRQVKEIPDWLLNYQLDLNAEVDMELASYVEVDGMAPDDGWLNVAPPIVTEKKKSRKKDEIAWEGEGEE
jgi:hypothetical protein